MSESNDLTAGAAKLMPEVIEHLEALVRIPSIAFPGFDPEPVHAMGAAASTPTRLRKPSAASHSSGPSAKLAAREQDPGAPRAACCPDTPPPTMRQILQAPERSALSFCAAGGATRAAAARDRT